MKLTKELIKIINDNLGYLKKGLTLDYSEGDEFKHYETEEIMYEKDQSEGTYFTRQEIVEEVDENIVMLETVEYAYILPSEDSDYQLNYAEIVEVGYYRSDGVEMIADNESGEFITIEEYLSN